MIEWSLFYRLLAIPEDIAEPTYYDLLNLEPHCCTEELVDRALNDRRMLLRQRISGPQFIPLVLKFESEQLNVAAATLRDPAKRAIYDNQLKQQNQPTSHQESTDQKTRLAREARAAIAQTVNPDGTLDPTQRDILARQLADIGLVDRDIQAVLSRIPDSRPTARDHIPAQEPRPTDDPFPADAPPPVNTPSLQEKAFFANAVDLAIVYGLLDPQDETRLLALADHLLLPRELALRIIEQRLHSKQARRGERNTVFLKDQFTLQVRSLHPNRQAGREQREYLLALAVMDGLPPTIAQQVLDEHLDPLADDNHNLPATVEHEPSIAELDNTLEEYLVSPDTPAYPQKPVVIALSVLGALLFALLVLLVTIGLNPSTPQDHTPAPPDDTIPTRPTDTSPPDTAQDTPAPTGRADTTTELADSPQPAGQPADAPATREPHEPAEPTGTTPTDKTPTAGTTDETTTATADPPLRPHTATGLPVLARAIRAGYTTANSRDELFADIALTTLACCKQVERFVSDSKTWANRLKIVRAASNHTEEIIRHISITPVPRPAVPIQLPLVADVQQYSASSTISHEDSQRLTADLSSDSSSRRCRAIEQLRVANTSQAADMLLTALTDTRLQQDPAAAARILRALRTMSDPDILPALIEAIGLSERPIVSHQIVHTLLDQTTTKPTGPAVLPRRHDRKQQQRCLTWWRARLAQGNLKWGTGTPFPTAPAARQPEDESSRNDSKRDRPQRSPDQPPPPWLNDTQALKLLTAVAYYSNHTADQLESYQWHTTNSAEPYQFNNSDLPIEIAPTAITAELATGITRTSNELLRLIRQHKKGPDYSLRADVVQLRRHARLAACHTLFQTLAVELDSQTELLTILLDESTGKTTPAKNSTRRTRRIFTAGSLGESKDVLQQIRQSCFNNLLLWETLRD